MSATREFNQQEEERSFKLGETRKWATMFFDMLGSGAFSNILDLELTVSDSIEGSIPLEPQEIPEQINEEIPQIVEEEDQDESNSEQEPPSPPSSPLIYESVTDFVGIDEESICQEGSDCEGWYVLG